MWDTQQATSSHWRGPSSPGLVSFPAPQQPCPHPSQAPQAKVPTRPPPQATCASSQDGYTCAEGALPALGNWGSLAIARRSSHSPGSSCWQTEPTCRARAAQFASATPPGSGGRSWRAQDTARPAEPRPRAGSPPISSRRHKLM